MTKRMKGTASVLFMKTSDFFDDKAAAHDFAHPVRPGAVHHPVQGDARSNSRRGT